MSRQTDRPESETVDPDAIARQLCERAVAEKRQQLAAARSTLDERQYEAAQQLCDRLLAALLAPPLAALDSADERPNQAVAEHVADLFDVEPTKTRQGERREAATTAPGSDRASSPPTPDP